MKKKVIKILKIIGNTFFVIFILAAIAFAITNINAKSKGDIPSIGNRGYMTVLTDSMNGKKKTSYKQGALVFVELTPKGSKTYKVGDIVLFYAQLQGMEEANYITHRIDKIFPPDEVSDYIRYQTKGDKATTHDQTPSGNDFKLLKEDVLGVITGHVNTVGYAIRWFQQPIGFFVIIVLPTILFLMVELIAFVKALMEYKQEGKGTVLALDKEALRQQLLEELKAEGKLTDQDKKEEK